MTPDLFVYALIAQYAVASVAYLVAIVLVTIVIVNIERRCRRRKES